MTLVAEFLFPLEVIVAYQSLRVQIDESNELLQIWFRKQTELVLKTTKAEACSSPRNSPHALGNRAAAAKEQGTAGFVNSRKALSPRRGQQPAPLSLPLLTEGQAGPCWGASSACLGTFQSAGLHQKQTVRGVVGSAVSFTLGYVKGGGTPETGVFPAWKDQQSFNEVMFKLSNAKQSGQMDQWMRGRGGCSRQREEFGQRREQGPGRLVARRVGTAECS